MDIPQLNLAARNCARKQPRTPYYESIVHLAVKLLAATLFFVCACVATPFDHLRFETATNFGTEKRIPSNTKFAWLITSAI